MENLNEEKLSIPVQETGYGEPRVFDKETQTPSFIKEEYKIICDDYWNETTLDPPRDEDKSEPSKQSLDTSMALSPEECSLKLHYDENPEWNEDGSRQNVTAPYSLNVFQDINEALQTLQEWERLQQGASCRRCRRNEELLMSIERKLDLILQRLSKTGTVQL